MSGHASTSRRDPICDPESAFGTPRRSRVRSCSCSFFPSTLRAFTASVVVARVVVVAPGVIVCVGSERVVAVAEAESIRRELRTAERIDLLSDRHSKNRQRVGCRHRTVAGVIAKRRGASGDAHSRPECQQRVGRRDLAIAVGVAAYASRVVTVDEAVVVVVGAVGAGRRAGWSLGYRPHATRIRREARRIPAARNSCDAVAARAPDQCAVVGRPDVPRGTCRTAGAGQDLSAAEVRAALVIDRSEDHRTGGVAAVASITAIAGGRVGGSERRITAVTSDSRTGLATSSTSSPASAVARSRRLPSSRRAHGRPPGRRRTPTCPQETLPRVSYARLASVSRTGAEQRLLRDDGRRDRAG